MEYVYYIFLCFCFIVVATKVFSRILSVIHLSPEMPLEFVGGHSQVHQPVPAVAQLHDLLVRPLLRGHVPPKGPVLAHELADSHGSAGLGGESGEVLVRGQRGQ